MIILGGEVTPVTYGQAFFGNELDPKKKIKILGNDLLFLILFKPI